MKNSPYLLFDFDGTLVDSFQIAVEKFTLLSDEFNFKKINDDEISKMRDLTSRQIVKYLKIPIYKIPIVLRSARKHMHNEMQSLLPFKNIPETLLALHNMKIPLGILTSNSSANVVKWLEHNKIRHLFNFIHVESSYFGKSRILRKILKTYDIDKSQAFYIGDETRDVDAAKKCNINSIAVTWGFNSEKILSEHKPHYIARKPGDILTMLINPEPQM